MSDGRKWLALVALIASIGGAGCGGDDDAGDSSEAKPTPTRPATVDAPRVEAALKKELNGVELIALPVPVYPSGGGAPEQSQVGGGRLKVRSVTCPPDVPVERGGTFTCDVDAGDDSATARVRQLDAKASRMSYNAKIESEAQEGLGVSTSVKGKLKVQ